MFPQTFIDQLKEKADIVSIIAGYIPLKKYGANFKGTCPFHTEKTGSFIVSPAKGIYKCFGCGAGGDVIKFVSEIDNIDFPEAVKKIAQLTNTPIPETENNTQHQYQQTQKQQLYTLFELANLFYIAQLKTEHAQPALQYLTQKRKFTTQTIQQFQIGYAPAGNSFWQYAKSKGYTEQICLQAGLIKKDQNGGIYDFYRNRIMFPIHHPTNGLVISFSARKFLPDQEKDTNIAKYINGETTPIFDKSQTLYNYPKAHQATKEQRKTNNGETAIILCEGITDIISLHQAGVHNTVAPLGTAFTAAQARLLARITNTITIITDGDKAGQKAANTQANILLSQDIFAQYCPLPNNTDPDELSQTTDPQQYIQQHTTDFVLWKAQVISDLLKNNPNPQITNYAAQQLRETLSKISDQLKQNIYLTKVKEIIGFDIPIQEQKTTATQKLNPKTPPTPRQTSAHRAIHNLILFALSTLNEGSMSIQFGDEIEQVTIGEFCLFQTYHNTEELYKMDILTHAQHQTIIEALQHKSLQYLCDHPEPAIQEIASQAIQYNLQVLDNNTTSDKENKAIHIINGIKLEHVELLIKQLTAQLSINPSVSTAIQGYTTQKQTLIMHLNNNSAAS